jgi:hypothetical protein
MADVALIVPSRGRPERLRDMLLGALEHPRQASIEVWVGLDDDDRSEYGIACDPAFAAGADVYVMRKPRRSLSSWTNLLAQLCLSHRDNPPGYLMSIGDDHMVRTDGWDKALIEAIAEQDGPGFAYGNDLFQGGNLPTAWMVHADVVRVLGWMMLPTCEHMYVDNAIRDLGLAADRLAYLPSVIIEHVHPNAGKAEHDDSYRESNRHDRYTRDGAAFEAWRHGQMARDAATLSALRY